MKNNEKGVALLITVLMLSLVLFLVLYFLSFSITENKISSSQLNGNSTYYLSESAINEVVWRLQNDPNWRNNFTSSSTWSTTTSKTNPLGYNGSYVVGVSNYDIAHASVIATSTINLPNGRTSRRVVKVNIYRATGASALGENAMLSDGAIDISSSDIVFNGGLHSNNNIVTSNNSSIVINGNLEAVGSFTNQNGNSTVTVSSTTFGSNQVAGPAMIFNLPSVDFNSSATSSMKSMAARIYTAQQFLGLCTGSCHNLNLQPGITYVVGNLSFNNANIDLKAPSGGALVIEGNASFTMSELDFPTQATSGPSGIFASGNLELKKVSEIDDVFYGVLYSGSTLTFGNVGDPHSTDEFVISGGIAARNIIFSSPVHNMTVTYNPAVVQTSLPGGSLSPVISTDHWEEQY
jgi:Tfp pilus assembly protein PilX